MKQYSNKIPRPNARSKLQDRFSLTKLYMRMTFPGKGARWDATLDADQIRNTAGESGTKLASRGATDFGPSGKEPAVSSARSS